MRVALLAAAAMFVASQAIADSSSFTVGETVKDNTGASIGQIVKLSADASGSPTAVIRMGGEQFAMPQMKLTQTPDGAVIGMTQAQIEAGLHQTGASTEATPDSALSSGSAVGAGVGFDAAQNHASLGQAAGGGMGSRR